MASGNTNYESSWADQWDPQPAYVSHENESKNKKKNNESGGGAKKKVEEGLTKTKEVASTSFKKVKQGTSMGISWIKYKYHKTTQKH